MPRILSRLRGRQKTSCWFIIAQLAVGIVLFVLIAENLLDVVQPVAPSLAFEHTSGRSLSSLPRDISSPTELQSLLIAQGHKGNVTISDPVPLATDSRVAPQVVAVSIFSSLHALALEEKRLMNAARVAATSVSRSQQIEEYSLLDSKGKDGKALLRRCPIKQGPLERDIKYKALTHVVAHLDYRGTAYKNPFPEETCVGLPCPYFGTCNKHRAVVSAVCHNPTMTNPHTLGDPPVKTTPPDSKVASEKEQSMKYSGDMLVFENVYLNHQGEIFNETHHFLIGGCYFLNEFEYKAKVTNVTHFHTLLNMVNWNSANFYHIVTEVLPEFLVSAQVLRLYEGIPVAFRVTQGQGMVSVWLDLINWELPKLNIHFIEGDHLFFAEKLVVPVHSFCGRPSGSVLKHLRAEVLDITGVSNGGGEAIVIFGRRPEGASRYIPEEGAVLKGLQDLYTESRVISFFGNLTVHDTKKLFIRAALYIGAHGAGMTNMIFMTPQSFILEVRPDNFHNPCYHYLSDRCELVYHAVVGKGDFSSPLLVAAENILSLVKEILPAEKLRKW